jgi:hypothetical protein
MPASKQNPEATEAAAEGEEAAEVEEPTYLGAGAGHELPYLEDVPEPAPDDASDDEKAEAAAAIAEVEARNAEVQALYDYVVRQAEQGEVLPYGDIASALVGYYVTNPEGKAYITAIEVAKRYDSALAMGNDIYVFGVDSVFHELYVDDEGDELEVPEPEVSQTPPSDEQLVEQAEAREKEAEEAAAPKPKPTQLPAKETAKADG